jgi:Glycosyltransferases involved in cell wall biogenesis
MRCLDAIRAGEAPPAEIIVVDQSRDTQVADALAAIPEHATPVRYVRQPRRGLSASRNAALALASQAMVAFTDDDCVPSAGWIATVHRVLAGDPAIAAVPAGSCLSVRSAPAPTWCHLEHRPTPVCIGGGPCPGRSAPAETLPPGETGSRASAGSMNGSGAGSPGRAAEDAELLYRLLLAGATIRYEPASLVYHERQTAAQRLASRTGYGHGIGALCALYLRKGDAYAGVMLASYLRGHGVGLARAVLHRDWFMARQRLLALGGCATGLRHGWAMR